jgi:hypothetical protein
MPGRRGGFPAAGDDGVGLDVGVPGAKVLDQLLNHLGPPDVLPHAEQQQVVEPAGREPCLGRGEHRVVGDVAGGDAHVALLE